MLVTKFTAPLHSLGMQSMNPSVLLIECTVWLIRSDKDSLAKYGIDKLELACQISQP